MTVVQEPYYVIRCDREECGVRLALEEPGLDWRVEETRDGILEAAEVADWRVDRDTGRAYCAECVEDHPELQP